MEDREFCAFTGKGYSSYEKILSTHGLHLYSKYTSVPPDYFFLLIPIYEAPWAPLNPWAPLGLPELPWASPLGLPGSSGSKQNSQGIHVHMLKTL